MIQLYTPKYYYNKLNILISFLIPISLQPDSTNLRYFKIDYFIQLNSYKSNVIDKK